MRKFIVACAILIGLTLNAAPGKDESRKLVSQLTFDPKSPSLQGEAFAAIKKWNWADPEIAEFQQAVTTEAEQLLKLDDVHFATERFSEIPSYGPQNALVRAAAAFCLIMLTKSGTEVRYELPVLVRRYATYILRSFAERESNYHDDLISEVRKIEIFDAKLIEILRGAGYLDHLFAEQQLERYATIFDFEFSAPGTLSTGGDAKLLAKSIRELASLEIGLPSELIGEFDALFMRLIPYIKVDESLQKNAHVGLALLKVAQRMKLIPSTPDLCDLFLRERQNG